MRNKRVTVEPLISHRFPLEKLQEAFELTAEECLKVEILP
jgi:threonine dehydrogenase-like Zn-dependent dehydrogenase